MMKKNFQKVDPTVTQNNTSINKLCACVDLQEFIKSHCLVREYSLQIKRLPREILINYTLYQIHKFQVV
ncbi:unnamed protein product [Rhizophagus irregularis]|uniref:Uncharacterized protein n=1 Tax=Rhizophagus irregularis TaxID=588596 RepID=A0A915ZNC8_9GLOM|nr:unnamed protein product [Rhizophagus irregularis]